MPEGTVAPKTAGSTNQEIAMLGARQTGAHQPPVESHFWFGGVRR
jgi:hypothetical protein